MPTGSLMQAAINDAADKSREAHRYTPLAVKLTNPFCLLGELLLLMFPLSKNYWPGYWTLVNPET